jgi:signal transduction histidine kinase
MPMTLRQKLLASYLFFVATLAALGAWSAWRLNAAGAVSERILSENYESVIAAQMMKESLERQDSAALFALLGKADRAARQMAENRQRFDAAFTRAAGNITEPGETEVIADIRKTRDEYYSAIDHGGDYFARLEPLFNRLRADVDRLLQLNQQAMLSKSADAQRVTHRALTLTVALAATLVAVGFGLAFTLSARIDRDAERLKTEFVGTASHELRTPLTTLQMGINLLQEQFAEKASDRQREILDMCREDAARLERLVTDLLDLSKMASGHMKPTLRPVPAATLIVDALRPSRPRVEAAHLDLDVNIDRTLPTVMADSAQIERVLANLIANAVNATTAGGRITVSARQSSHGVQVSVADTGRGIPPEYIPKLFEEFVQVPDAATGNAGLGLAISKQIITAHGGSITADSEPGRGATFTFTLPVAQDGGADSPALHMHKHGGA